MPLSAESSPAPGEAGPWIEGQLITHLMTTLADTQWPILAVLPVMFGVLYGHVWLPALCLWVLAGLATVLYRDHVLRRYRRDVQHAPPPQQQAFLRRYRLVWPLSALVWASSSALHLRAPVHAQFVGWLILACIATFSITSFASHLPTMRAYLNTLALTLMGVLAWHIGADLHFQGPVDPYGMLLLIALYWRLLLRTGGRLHDTLRDSVHLQRANADLIRSLKQQTRTALEAVQTKNRFIASAAHDLRQPVHALGLYADWLRNEPELVAELTPKILQSTRAVHQLFDALFDLAQLDAGKIKPQWQTVALAPLVQELADQYLPQAEAKGISLVWQVEPVRAWSDPIMLRRILGNLLSNAVRHTQRGGVLLAVRARGPALRVEVWDSGDGIAREHQSLVFREFYRVPRHHGTEEGFGLGLSIVSRLGSALGHRISLRSRPGRGSVFRVTLPLAHGQPADSGFEQAGGTRQV